MDHSHIVSNEATCDSEGVSTHIQLSQEDEAYSSPLCLPTSHPEHTITPTKRKRKVKKTSKSEHPQNPAEQTFSQASIEGASTNVECITYLYSTGHVRPGTSIDDNLSSQ